jgi:glycosyltransferase involved in cell wall biosynthesis
MFDISVIVCTHNPRPEYLKRVFEALEKQTLPKDRWEMLVIDNLSKEPLAKNWNLSWHPNARHVREEELGLIPARLRGISESKGGLLVFVDDDNVLKSNYLEEALRIGSQWPILGAWGGSIQAEIDGKPAPELEPLVPLLAIRKVESPRWSNQKLTGNHAIPIGAGMCIRKGVASKYHDIIATDTARKKLDRQGTNLSSSGDVDLALTACDAGYGTGLFPELHVTHLIPNNRIQRDYLLKLEEEVVFGHLLLDTIRGTPIQQIAVTERIKAWYSLIRNSGIRRSIIRAHWRARLRHVKTVNAMNGNSL